MKQDKLHELTTQIDSFNNTVGTFNSFLSTVSYDFRFFDSLDSALFKKNSALLALG